MICETDPNGELSKPNVGVYFSAKVSKVLDQFCLHQLSYQKLWGQAFFNNLFFFLFFFIFFIFKRVVYISLGVNPLHHVVRWLALSFQP